MENFANNTQLEELAAFMASQINVPTIGIGGGYAPIGAINFFDATVAPQDWLACDGSVYNIADYPQLAEWYATQHGASNFYGGNGTTTFAVPDLQGEFLRGTGTNSYPNQGSGANVGVHQDATQHLSIQAVTDGRILTFQNGDYGQGNTNMNPDSNGGTATVRHIYNRASTDSNYPWNPVFTSRPTNTSFLICVKAVVAGEVYSTEERVVGTWIDGKPIYQKTYNGSISTTEAVIDATMTDSIIDRVIDMRGISQSTNPSSNKKYWSSQYRTDASDMFRISIHPINGLTINLGSTYPQKPCTYQITVQYTKTTD